MTATTTTARTPPKGFAAFYTLASPAPNLSKARQAVEESAFEKAILDHHAQLRKNTKRIRRVVIGGSLIALFLAYRGYRKFRLESSSPHNPDGTIAFRSALVDLQAHSVLFRDEQGHAIARRSFIDFGTLESELLHDKEVLIAVHSYYPLLPMSLLLLLPLLAFFQGGFRMAARAASIPGVGDKKRFKFKKDHDVPTRLNDVAGLTEAKHEVIEIIDFLKNPERYRRMGAVLPKGVLLDGPPGVGKTLLAKAVAGEAMVPFVSCSGSEFDEVYVGVGAKRVRELFKEARKVKPCVVFIDEIDAFGRKRRNEQSNSRGTLNAFLSELDGFNDASGVIVLAATNRADILDNALTRSGRFDRKITLDRPPHKDRVAIAKVHLRPLKLDKSLSADDCAEALASLTPGCSGADIFNICNEAAIMASRENKDSIKMDDFHNALDRVLVGLERKARKLSAYERERIAYHEAGHVVASWYQELPDPVIKTTIVPRGGSMVGVTQTLPQDVYIKTQQRLRENMIQSLGGFAAEEYFFQDLSTSAAEDLQRVTMLANEEITLYGMDPKEIGHFGFPRSSDALQKPFGPQKENAVDEAVTRIVEEVSNKARALLKLHVEKVRIVAGLLLKQETLTARELWMVLGDRPVMSKEFSKYLQSS